MRGIKPIIAIDRVQSRLELAESFGATHTMGTSLLAGNFIPAVQGVTGGLDVSASVDATGKVNA